MSERTGTRGMTRLAVAALGIASFGPIELRRSSPAYGRLKPTPKPGWTGADVVGPFASALGVPIAAMDTGGTRDILVPGVTGLLSQDVAGFSRDLARLAADAALRSALGAAARADVHRRFAASSVVERVEQVYRTLLTPGAA